MALICSCCGKDINAIGQDNVSYVPNKPLCEDCEKEMYLPMDDNYWEDEYEDEDDYEWEN